MMMMTVIVVVVLLGRCLQLPLGSLSHIDAGQTVKLPCASTHPTSSTSSSLLGNATFWCGTKALLVLCKMVSTLSPFLLFPLRHWVLFIRLSEEMEGAGLVFSSFLSRRRREASASSRIAAALSHVASRVERLVAIPKAELIGRPFPDALVRCA
jgi:hypothetical protein